MSPGQGEQLFAHAAVERGRVAVLEVGAPTAVDQQRVAGKYALADAIGVVPVGVARREQRVDADAAELEGLTLFQPRVDAGEIVERRVRDAAASLRLELACRGEVIGVDMGVERIDQLQAELVEFLEVALPGRQHWVDQHRLAGLLAAEQVGIGAGHRFEELPKNHVTS